MNSLVAALVLTASSLVLADNGRKHSCPATADRPSPPHLPCIGERPEHDFRHAIFNGPERRSLADFAGKPLLVTYYSPRCGACVNAGVPAMLRLQEEYGESVQVLFVDLWSQPNEARAYALRRRWLASRAMWTDDSPFDARGLQVPTAVLLSERGEVVMAGNPLAQKRQLEQALEREVRVASAVPAGVPDGLRQAWVQYRQGKLGRAIELASRELAAEDGVTANAAREAVQTFRQRGVSQIEWVERLLETGHFVRAGALATELGASVRGDRELEERLAEVVVRLDAPELKREREAAHALVEIENELLLEGPRAPTLERLERFLLDYEQTQAADRARQLYDVATFS